MERQYKRKPTDRKLATTVTDTIPESVLFEKLQDVETRLDTLINRKRLDIQDVIGRSTRRNKTLRIFISSSVTNQAWQSGTLDYEFGGVGQPQEMPQWTLRVEGRLVDEDADHHRMFSSMFTSIIVELARDGDDDAASAVVSEAEASGADTPSGDAGPGPREPEIVEWHEVPPHSTEPRVEFDGLDIRRHGDSPVKAKIILQLKEYPDKFRLSPALQQVLGVQEESKPGAVVSLWQYIRFNKLQDVDEKRLIKCDAALKNLFGRETMTFPQLVELLGQHLSPREPISIEYTINPGEHIDNRDLIFDVPLQVDDPLRQDLITMIDTWYQDGGALRKLDEDLVTNVQNLNLLSRQREFYGKLAEDPSTFLDNWVASQVRDLKTIYSDSQFSEETVRHSSFYSDELLNSSIHLFLNTK